MRKDKKIIGSRIHKTTTNTKEIILFKISPYQEQRIMINQLLKSGDIKI